MERKAKHQAASAEEGRLESDGRNPVFGLPVLGSDAKVLGLPVRHRHVHPAELFVAIPLAGFLAVAGLEYLAGDLTRGFRISVAEHDKVLVQEVVVKRAHAARHVGVSLEGRLETPAQRGSSFGVLGSVREVEDEHSSSVFSADCRTEQKVSQLRRYGGLWTYTVGE